MANERSNINEQKTCKYCFTGPKRGVCDMVSQIRNQAGYEEMRNRDEWQEYIKRMEVGPLSQCLFPQQLTYAINTIKPKFEEGE